MTNRIFRAAVGAFIFNEDGELLVILKHNYVNKWDIVKGGIDFNGENDQTTLKREIFEELGVENPKILRRSMVSKVFLKPKFDWSQIDTNEFVGQAQVNYWVFIAKGTEFKIPNREIEQFKWITIDKQTIKEYFNVHDIEEGYQNFLPIEWSQIKNELLTEVSI